MWLFLALVRVLCSLLLLRKYLPVHSSLDFTSMFQQLEYQECYRKVAHESVINAMVLSPDGRRLITGSGDSTVLMWSTQSGSTLCRIKAHSPVLSLAWLKNSNGFLFGCENGTLASVDISEVLNMCSEPFTPALMLTSNNIVVCTNNVFQSPCCSGLLHISEGQQRLSNIGSQGRC